MAWCPSKSPCCSGCVHHAVIRAGVPELRPCGRGQASARTGSRVSGSDTRVSSGAHRSAYHLQIVVLARLESLGVRRVTGYKGKWPSGRVGAWLPKPKPWVIAQRIQDYTYLITCKFRECRAALCTLSASDAVGRELSLWTKDILLPHKSTSSRFNLLPRNLKYCRKHLRDPDRSCQCSSKFARVECSAKRMREQIYHFISISGYLWCCTHINNEKC